MHSIPAQLLLQIILIFINAFFAATELAVISLNSVRLRKMEDEGDKLAVKLLKLVEEPAGFLSTIQVGITLSGYLGSAFAAENFSGYLVSWIYEDIGFTLLPEKVLYTLAIVVITIILAYFTLVFGELVPKRIAMQKPLEVARLSYHVVSGIAVVMHPVIRFLSFSTNLVLRLLHLKTEAEEENVTEEEIRMLVDLGEEKGTIDENEKEWIQNIFDFDELSVRHVMTRRTDVAAVSLHAETDEIIRIITESGHSRFPVYDEDIDDIVGILNAKDFLLNRYCEHPQEMKELLRPAYLVPETIYADNLFRNMQKEKVHIAVVIDEYGATEGIITIEDLVEEIVGNIYDEFDPAEKPEIEQLEENLWRVSGSVSIDELTDQLDIQGIPEERDYDTVGGMIFSCLNKIPQDGTQVEVEAYGLKLHVEHIEDRRIETVLIQKEK